MNEALNILVVDDQPEIRRCLQDLLTALGHLVVTVPGPHEALASLEGTTVKFDCMFVDVELPIMSGNILAEQASEREPRVRIVMMSGYPRAELEDERLVRPDQAFLQKPFRVAELQSVLDVVREWRSIA